jgi:hypothetical protein
LALGRRKEIIMKTKYYLMVAMASLMISMGDSQALAVFEGYGSLAASSEITQAFDGYRMDPDLNYYFSGSETWPDAIIGVNKAYTLHSTLWRKIVATPEAFKNFVSGMKSRPSTSALHGYAVLDDKKRPIGVWYSMFGVRGYVRMESEKTVDIGTPINPIRPELSAP